MGKRLGRRRLYALEKKGQTVTGSVGRGVSGSLVSRTVSRDGQRIITDIVIDAGSSVGALYAAGTRHHVVGHTGSAFGDDVAVATAYPAHFGEIDAVTNGIVDLVEVTVVEGFTGSQDLAAQRFCLKHHTTATLHFSSSGGTVFANLGNLATLGSSSAFDIDDNSLNGKYLYLARDGATNGSPVVASSNTGLGALSAGKILIRLHGVAVPESL